MVDLNRPRCRLAAAEVDGSRRVGVPQEPGLDEAADQWRGSASPRADRVAGDGGCRSRCGPAGRCCRRSRPGRTPHGCSRSSGHGPWWAGPPTRRRLCGHRVAGSGRRTWSPPSAGPCAGGFRAVLLRRRRGGRAGSPAGGMSGSRGARVGLVPRSASAAGPQDEYREPCGCDGCDPTVTTTPLRPAARRGVTVLWVGGAHGGGPSWLPARRPRWTTTLALRHAHHIGSCPYPRPVGHDLAKTLRAQNLADPRLSGLAVQPREQPLAQRHRLPSGLSDATAHRHLRVPHSGAGVRLPGDTCRTSRPSGACEPPPISVANPPGAPTMADLGTFAPSTPRAVDPMPVPSGTPLLLGREREIAELDEALGLAAQGTPQIVLVGGDAGIGKTTLVADLERRAAELGFTVATGHCLDIEAGISFAPVVEAVRSLLAGVDDLGSRPSARRMLTLLDPEAPTESGGRPCAGRPHRGRPGGGGRRPGAAGAGGHALGGPFDPGLRGHAVPDRARGAAAGADLPQRRAPPPPPVPEDLGRDQPDPRVPTHRPRRVGPRRHRGHRRRPHRRATRPVGGRFGAGAVRGQPAVRRGARWPPTRKGFPGHLSDLLLARIDALDEGPRALLRVASVNGTRLDTDTLAELAGLDQTQTESYLREALDANVLRQNGESLEFRHPLLREAAYDDLMPDERTRIHGTAGRDPPGQGRRRARSRTASPEPARLPLERRPRPAPHPGGVGPRRPGGEATGSGRGHHPARTRAVVVGPGPRRRGRGRPPAGRARRPPGRVGGRPG